MVSLGMLTNNDLSALLEYHGEYIEEYKVTTVAEPGSDDFLDAIQPVLMQDQGVSLVAGATKDIRGAVLEPLTDIAQAEYGNKVLLISDDASFGAENLARIPFPVLSDANPLADFDAFMQTVRGYDPRMVVVDDVSSPLKAFIAFGVAHVLLPRPNKVTVLAGIESGSSLGGVRNFMVLVESEPTFHLYDTRFFEEHGGGCGGDEHIVEVVLNSYLYAESIPDSEKIVLEVASPWQDR